MSYNSVFRPDLFAGQNILVTGGGSGIGRCIAHEISALGARILLLGRTLEKLQLVQAEIEADGGQADCFSCDIRDEEGIQQIVATMVERYGVIHGVVNNAGGQFPAPLESISKNGFEAVVRSNLVGTFLVSREVYKQSMQANGGSVVNITADNTGGMPMMGHSGAARAGVENFTQTAAVEWAEQGVRVNAVAPGYIISSGMDSYESPEMKALIPRMKDYIPLNRMGMEAEISSAICFLLSDGARYITGQTIAIDGGSSLKTNSPLWPLRPAQNNQPYNGFHRSELPKILQGAEDQDK